MRNSSQMCKNELLTNTYDSYVLARVTCETIQVIIAEGQVFFLGDLPFLPHLTIDSAQN